MKNRDKYKNELINVLKVDGRICGFAKKHEVYRMFGKDKEIFCGEISCVDCAVALQLWLDEEYEDPAVYWSKVPVDTLVRVRNCDRDSWKIQYFDKYEEQNPYDKFSIWDEGKTSKTADGATNLWRYCELVEVENGSN